MKIDVDSGDLHHFPSRHMTLNPPEMCVVVSLHRNHETELIASLHRNHETKPIEKGEHMTLWTP
jgi:hypothetical protein